MVVVGSLNLDLVVRTARLPGAGETVPGIDAREFAGGKGLNQAVAASRAGASVAIVGAVGDDAAGSMLRSLVVEEGIDDTWLTTAPGTATGRAIVMVDEEGENSIVVIPGANAAVVSPADPPIGTVTLAQLEIPIEVVTAVFTTASEHGSRTILNPAPSTRLPRELLEACSLVVPNEHEFADVGGPGELLAAGVDHVVVTRGALGVDVVDANGTVSLDAFDVSPIDTTGAGDAFCGNLAARLAHGDPLDESVRWGAAAGALATTGAGAVPSLPTRHRTAALVDHRTTDIDSDAD